MACPACIGKGTDCRTQLAWQAVEALHLASACLYQYGPSRLTIWMKQVDCVCQQMWLGCKQGLALLACPSERVLHEMVLDQAQIAWAWLMTDLGLQAEGRTVFAAAGTAVVVQSETQQQAVLRRLLLLQMLACAAVHAECLLWETAVCFDQ